MKSLRIAHLSLGKILSIINVTTKNNIPRMISFVNVTMALTESVLVKLGVIKARANHAAERLPVTADNALRNATLVLFTKIF